MSYPVANSDLLFAALNRELAWIQPRPSAMDDDGESAFQGAIVCRYILRAPKDASALTAEEMSLVVVSVPVAKGRAEWEFNTDNFTRLAGSKFAEWEQAHPEWTASGDRSPAGDSTPAAPTVQVMIGSDPRTAELEALTTLFLPLLKSTEARVVQGIVMRVLQRAIIKRRNDTPFCPDVLRVAVDKLFAFDMLKATTAADALTDIVLATTQHPFTAPSRKRAREAEADDEEEKDSDKKQRLDQTVQLCMASIAAMMEAGGDRAAAVAATVGSEAAMDEQDRAILDLAHATYLRVHAEVVQWTEKRVPQ